jgi:hypothetical protein
MDCRDPASSCSCSLSQSFIALNHAHRILQERYNKMKAENNRLIKTLKLLPPEIQEQLKISLNQSNEQMPKTKQHELANRKAMDRIPVAATRTSLIKSPTSNTNTITNCSDSKTCSTTTTEPNISCSDTGSNVQQSGSYPAAELQLSTSCTSDPVNKLSDAKCATDGSSVRNDEDSGICNNYKDQGFVSSNNNTGMLVEVRGLIEQSMCQGEALKAVRNLLTRQTNMLRTIINTQQLSADARALNSGEWTMVTP